MQLGNRKSQHSFAQIPSVNIPRSKFNRSFTVKDTMYFDDLVPIYLDEVLPGDTYNVSLSVFARLATQAVPIMDNMYIDYFFFFVPNRLVFDRWEKLNGAQDNPADSTDIIMPIMTPGAAFTINSIYDHFGLPTGVANVPIANTLPFRGYYLIWNEWFRDQNLQNSLTVPTDNGPDVQGDFTLQKRNKVHDYFTSCLPWPQKGDAVELPLGTSAPVIGIGKNNATFPTAGATNMRETGGILATYANSAEIDGTTANGSFYIKEDPSNTGYPLITADLSSATAATINQLRQAFSMQSLFELDARGGTRYVEILRAHFGVISPDFRLQRPEYLGGGQTRINSHPVAQTSETDTSPQATLAAYATSSGQGIGFSKSFVEHGYIIGLACARADITYQQGLNRLWSRSTRYDFYWPKLSELGEQEVLNQEIYVQGASADTSVFGYQERYSEYRYKPSEIRGQFRSTAATSLDVWHLAEEFGSLPALNSTFIRQNTPIDRAIVVTDEPDLLMDMWFSQTCARPMPVYSTPATLGRF